MKVGQCLVKNTHVKLDTDVNANTTLLEQELQPKVVYPKQLLCTNLTTAVASQLYVTPIMCPVCWGFVCQATYDLPCRNVKVCQIRIMTTIISLCSLTLHATMNNECFFVWSLFMVGIVVIGGRVWTGGGLLNSQKWFRMLTVTFGNFG